MTKPVTPAAQDDRLKPLPANVTGTINALLRKSQPASDGGRWLNADLIPGEHRVAVIREYGKAGWDVQFHADHHNETYVLFRPRKS